MSILENISQNLFPLTNEEKHIISILRQKSFQEIKLLISKGMLLRIEATEHLSAKSRLREIMDGGDFQRIEFIQEQGNIIAIKRTLKIAFKCD